MSINYFGRFFRFTSYGESHGPALGCIIDGVPPQVPLCEDDIQPFLDKRKPGQNRYTTQRKEADIVKILSGVFEGKTTGTALSMIIENQDQRSKDYSDIAQKYRPGHADYTYQQKYGIRDYRGGGRSSARETVVRVAVGAVAQKILTTLLPTPINFISSMIQMGTHKINYQQFDAEEIHRNPFFCADKNTAIIWEDMLQDIRKKGSSIGAVIELTAQNVPIGLGAPVYGKLDADIASAIMGINAVKAVEIGDGFDVANATGETNADDLSVYEDNVSFSANHAGGILGGISTGQDIIVRFAVKPTSSILTPRSTITTDNQNTTIVTKGRHDPCVGIRAVPIGEAMLAITLCDHMLLHRAQCGTL